MAANWYIYFQDRIRGPLPDWEIKLTASKYREFFVYIGEKGWVDYNTWKNLIVQQCTDAEPLKPPHKSSLNLMMFRRFLKRTLGKDHH